MGLYSNIHAKRERIKAGSGETMRKPGDKGAPTASNFKQASKTTQVMKAKSKPMVEKKTGEKYASKSVMAKHEKKESPKQMIKEYGMKAAMAKLAKKK
jgi:hypothetical protein